MPEHIGSSLHAEFLGVVAGRPSAPSPVVYQGGFWLVKTVQPTENVGHAITDLTPDSDAGRAAAVGAQV